MKVRSCSVKAGINIKQPKIKSLSDIAVIAVESPEKVYIPTKMIKGVTLSVVVKAGDEVKIGTRIAVSGENVIVSSVSGVVDGVIEAPSVYGGNTQVVVIKNNFLETRESFVEQDITKCTRQDLFNAMTSVSIVDYDGQTLKSKIDETDKTNSTLIINLVSDEFFQQTNLALIKERLEDCVLGVKTLMKIMDAKKLVFAVGKSQKLLFADFVGKLDAEFIDIEKELMVVQEKFPIGDETQLVGRYANNSKLKNSYECHKAGIMAVDIFSVYALKKLVVDGESIDLRPVSIIEKTEKIKTYNAWVKIGTNLGEVASTLLVDCVESAQKLVAGGFMRGVAQGAFDAGWPLALKSIVIFKDKLSDQPTELPCISCGRCKAVCPVGINPSEIDRSVINKDRAEVIRLGSEKCTRCGCCSYVCPSKRYLAQRINLYNTQK